MSYWLISELEIQKVNTDFKKDNISFRKTSHLFERWEGGLKKPISAGNKSFRKHNNKYFSKTERMRKLNKKEK